VFPARLRKFPALRITLPGLTFRPPPAPPPMPVSLRRAASFVAAGTPSDEIEMAYTSWDTFCLAVDATAGLVAEAAREVATHQPGALLARTRALFEATPPVLDVVCTDAAAFSRTAGFGAALAGLDLALHRFCGFMRLFRADVVPAPPVPAGPAAPLNPDWLAEAALVYGATGGLFKSFARLIDLVDRFDALLDLRPRDLPPARLRTDHFVRVYSVLAHIHLVDAAWVQLSVLAATICHLHCLEVHGAHPPA